MAATKGLGTTGDGVGTVTPLDHKLAQSGLLTKRGAGSNLIRPGVFFDGVVNLVQGTAGMSYNVQPFTAALSRSAAAGTVLICNDGVVNVATTAAPGSNSRIDIVYVWQREFSLDGVNSNPVIGVVQGAPAASPVAPSLAAFPGALELARITVAAGATATNGGGVTINQTAPFTSTAGGLLVFRNETERNAAVVGEGQLGWLLDMNYLQVFDGTSWAPVDLVNRQLDGTNSIITGRTQAGIGKITGNNTATISEVVTFPVPFKTGTIPMVIVNYMGSRTAGAFNAAGLSSGVAAAQGVIVSASQFTALINAGGSLPNTLDFYYSWIAIGESA